MYVYRAAFWDNKCNKRNNYTYKIE